MPPKPECIAIHQDIRRNAEGVVKAEANLKSLGKTVDVIAKDVKTLLRLNGTRAGQLGELKGKVTIICTLVLSVAAIAIAVIISR